MVRKGKEIQQIYSLTGVPKIGAQWKNGQNYLRNCKNVFRIFLKNSVENSTVQGVLNFKLFIGN